MEKLIRICAFLAFFVSSDAQGNGTCLSPQYLEYGKRGIIECAFPGSFLAVYWFSSTEPDDSQKIIYYSNSQTQGEGYLSGEFNLLPDGSLVIENVTLQHDHVFTVVVLHRMTDDAIPTLVTVVVTVKPRELFPAIDICDGHRFCISEAVKTGTLSCRVSESRPPVTLRFWTYSESQRNWMEVSSLQSFSGETLQTSVISVRLPKIKTFAIYVCAADEPPFLLDHNKSVIVIKGEGHPSQKETKPILAEKGSDVEFNCSLTETPFVVWMKQYQNATFAIARTFEWRGYPMMKDTEEGYHLTEEGNLIISDVTLKDEGTYVCLTGEGPQKNLKSFDLTVYVQPKPNKIVVDGCIATHDCSLPVRRTGRLRCGLLGVRPVVPLTWRFVETSSPLNKFQNHKFEVEKNVDLTYDVTVSSEYNIQDNSKGPLDVECFVKRTNDTPEVYWLQLSTQVSLQVASEVVIDSRSDALYVIFSVVIIMLEITQIVLFFVEPKYCGRRKQVGKEDAGSGSVSTSMAAASGGLREEQTKEKPIGEESSM